MARSWLLSLIGLAIALVLVVALLEVSGLRLAQVVDLVARCHPAWVGALIAATALHIQLSSEKWRLVEARLGDSEPSRTQAFAYSAIGSAAGQLLPIQLASAIARGLGNRFDRGSGGGRGVAASLYEQMFDLLAVSLIALAATIALFAGRPALLPILAPLAILIGIALVRALPALADRFAGHLGKGRIGRAGATLRQHGLLSPGLMLRLYLISVARLAVLLLMAVQVAAAMGSPIPALHLAVALPFAVLASVLSMLPGGIGSNEWSFAAVLTALGAPLPIAAAWVLVNRVLVAQASIVIALASLVSLRRPRRLRQA